MSTPMPGDKILDRFLPDATAVERDAARENLRRLARLILRVQTRLERDNPQPETRAKAGRALESESSVTIL